jgi:hypothetical protein
MGVNGPTCHPIGNILRYHQLLILNGWDPIAMLRLQLLRGVGRTYQIPVVRKERGILSRRIRILVPGITSGIYSNGKAKQRTPIP